MTLPTLPDDPHSLPFWIVQDCKAKGFYRPADVIWIHFGFDEWGDPVPEQQRQTCRCGQPIYSFQLYGFQDPMTKYRVRLVQCYKCKRIYWSDPDE